MKTSCPLLRLAAVILLLFASVPRFPARAETAINAYDQLGRTLAPIAAIFAPGSENRALVATLVLEEMTGLPPGQAGGRLELLLEPPDRVLLRGVFGSSGPSGSPGGKGFAACRVGQEIWIEPGQQIASVIPPSSSPAGRKKKKKGGHGLAPLKLPFPPEQLVLLPALFVVKDLPPGEAYTATRVLEARFMPMLAESLGLQEWSARLAYRGGKLEGIELLRPGWNLKVRVETLDVRPAIPTAAWQPVSTDVIRFSGEEARRWLEAAGAELIRAAGPLVPRQAPKPNQLLE